MSATGKILCEEAYARGKMLDNSSWKERLPNGITPSDADLMFDSQWHGLVLTGEVSARTDDWRGLSAGQRMIYQTLARQNGVAALVHHSVPLPGIVDTYYDIDSFSIMYWDEDNKCLRTAGPFPGDEWRQFVPEWYADTKAAIRRLLDLSTCPV